MHLTSIELLNLSVSIALMGVGIRLIRTALPARVVFHVRPFGRRHTELMAKIVALRNTVEEMSTAQRSMYREMKMVMSRVVTTEFRVWQVQKKLGVEAIEPADEPGREEIRTAREV